MSDGNFNRSLLPHTPYHSGLQAGKAMARMQAIETFKCYLATPHPDFTEEERIEHSEIFKKMRSAKLYPKELSYSPSAQHQSPCIIIEFI